MPEDFDAWLQKMLAMKDFDPEAAMPEHLVVKAEAGRWLEPSQTGNPSRIAVYVDVPTRSLEVFLQEIPAGQASDLQRHVHESVHCVIEGNGYSEIGPRRVEWKAGDFVYTPSLVWHRHYNDGEGTVRMLLVENSRLLDHLGLNRRDSAGLVSYAEHTATNKESE